jgi:NitT/TauT family transport system substrate-binding protein
MPPFAQMELDKPGIRKVITSTEILGGPMSFNVIAATGKFYNDNPKLVAIFMKALQEATDFINRDKKAAAETYLRMTNGKQPVEDMVKTLNAPGIEYTLVPRNIRVAQSHPCASPRSTTSTATCPRSTPCSPKSHASRWIS